MKQHFIKDFFKSCYFVLENSKGWTIFSAISILVAGFSPYITLMINREIINYVSLHLKDMASGGIQGLLSLLLLQGGIQLLLSLIRFANDYLDKKTEMKIDFLLQKKLNLNISALDYSVYENPEFYNHCNRLTTNMGARFLSPIKNFINLIKIIINLFTFTYLLFSFHWFLFILAAVVSIPSYFLNYKISKRRYDVSVQQTPTIREIRFLSNLFTEKNGIKEIKAFGLKSYFLNMWETKVIQNNKIFLSLVKKQNSIKLSMESLSILTFGVTSLIIFNKVLQLKMLIGDYVSINQAVVNTQSSMLQFTEYYNQFREDLYYISDYYSFQETFSCNIDALNCNQTLFRGNISKAVDSAINMENVSYSYPDSENLALKNINLKIKTGEKVAIVGANGSGKTTLVKCILGLYKVNQGRIFIDNSDIDFMDESQISKLITVIFQDFVKYPYTLRENICIGDIENKSDYNRLMELINLLEINLYEYPNGLDTYLGNLLKAGKDLSGGQWQKIAIARALFSPADIIILDEPTSAVDPLTEQKLFHNMNALTQGRTTILISHRMASVKMADRIIVLDKGGIIEQGSHEELMNLGKQYFKMYNSQALQYSLST